MAKYTGTSANNTYSGTIENDLISGLNGNDLLKGAYGNDSIDGGNGNDTLFGGYGSDTLLGGPGNDYLDGGLNHDQYKFANAWGVDTIIDIGGTDLVNMSAVTARITANLTSSGGSEVVSGDNRINWANDAIEYFLSGSNNDLIDGNSLKNILNGGNGNDTLRGGGGNDTLVGGAGADSLLGGEGADEYYYDDTIFMTGTVHKDIINDTGVTISDKSDAVRFTALTTGVDIRMDLSSNMVRLMETNTISIINTIAGIERFYLTAYDDIFFTLNSDPNSYTILSGSGNDHIVAQGSGNNRFVDSHGSDTYFAGAGNDSFFFRTPNENAQDIIYGGAGNNWLILSTFKMTDFFFYAVDTGSDGDAFLNDLILYNPELDWEITLDDYFNNTSTDDDASGAGAGHIDFISFSDRQNLNLSDVQSILLPF